MAATRALRRDAGTTKPVESPPHNHVFRDFGGINTQAKRQAIQPNEFAWIEGIMPIGHGRLAILAANTAVATVPSGLAYNWLQVSLGGVNYMAFVTTTGHAYLMALDGSYAIVEMTDPTTPQLSFTGVTIQVWNAERVLFMDPVNGYASWKDGIWYRNGTLIDVIVTDGGAYTAVPTVGFVGGGGAGATAVANMGINGGQAINTAGTGYAVGDILTMVGGTFDSVGKLKVITVGGAGDVTNVAVFDPGSYTALPTAPVSVTGGAGTAFDFNPVYAVLSVTVTSGGTAPYSDPPTVTFTASGESGLVDPLVISAAGTGYVPGEILTLVGGTFTTAATVKVLVTVGGGVNQVQVVERGVYSIVPGDPIATTGGGADDCTLTGNWNGALTAKATAVLVTGPETGQDIATFANRVWIAQGRKLIYSAPDSWYNFVSDGAGEKENTDSTLHSIIERIIAANNFLYYFGIDSCNVVGDVQVNALGDTVFSDTNLTSSIGSQQYSTFIAYYRSVLFMNPTGVYSIYGSTPIKMSDPLDGIFEQWDGNAVKSAGTVSIYNILCAAFFLTATPPGETDERSFLGIFFNRKWFLAPLPTGIILIGGAIDSAVQALFATDGTTIYKMFDDPDTPITWRVITPYWDMDDLTRGKQVMKFGVEVDVIESAGTIEVCIDALTNVPPYQSEECRTVDLSNPIQWANDSGQIVQWANDHDEIVEWSGGGGYTLIMQDTDLGDSGGNFGKYVGMTVSSQAIRGSISSLLMQYIYREMW